MAPRFLTMSEVLLILQDQIRRYGGSYGVRDPGLLSSGMAMPRATYEGQIPLHETSTNRLRRMRFTCARTIRLWMGTKRTALASALVFLSLNGVELEDPKGELYELMMAVAESGVGKQEIAATFRRLKGKRRGKS